MTEEERRIAALLAQAQLDRDSQPVAASPLANKLAETGMNPQMSRAVKSFYMDTKDYADEPQSAVGKAIDDYRAHKRDDVPAMIASGVANVASMPLKMMTLEGMAGLAKDAGRVAQVPYNVLTSPEPVSTAQMVQPAADMAMMAPLGGVAAGRMAPAERVAYSNSKEGAVPGLLSAGDKQGITAYHGASSAYKDDVYNPRKSQYRAFFAAESPDLANSFARSYGDSPRVYPVTISDTAKIFDPKGNPAHGQMLAEAIDANPGLVAGSLMGKDTIRRLATEGDGGIMEMSGVQQWLKRKGFDGWKFEDTAANPGIENRASYGMLKPGHVKSSITGETLYSNSKEGALPGLLSAGDQPKSLMERLAAAKPEPTYYRGVQDTEHPYPIDPNGPVWATDHLAVASAYGAPENGARPGVLELNARFQNPLIADAGGNTWGSFVHDGRRTSSDLLARDAKNSGHDGLIINNVIDDGTSRWEKGQPSTTIAALQRGTLYDAKTGNLFYANPDEAALPGLLRSAQAGEQEYRTPHTLPVIRTVQAMRNLDVPRQAYNEFSWRRRHYDEPLSESVAGAVEHYKDIKRDTNSHFNALAEQRKMGPGEKFRYEMTDKDGNHIGAAEGTVHGDTMFFDWLGDPSMGASNKLGVSGLRSLREQVRADFPNVVNFKGERISGARAKSGANDRLQSVKLLSNPEEASAPGLLSAALAGEQMQQPDTSTVKKLMRLLSGE